MNIVDIMFYVKNETNENLRDRMIKNLRNIEGVIAPGFVPNRDKLLVVAYDPVVVNSSVFRDTLNKMDVSTSIVAI